jgi:ribosomal protein L16/L10AE
MGKGKGNFLRYALRVPANCMLFEFFGWHPQYLHFIKNMFFKKTFVSLTIYTKEISRERPVSNNRNYSYEFIKKYNYS